MKKYFSFIGCCLCRKIRRDSVVSGKHIYNLATAKTHFDFFEIEGRESIVLLIVSYVWYKEYNEDHYIVLKSSFDFNPMVPISTFGEDLKYTLQR